MPSVAYRRWSPPASPVQIEFPDALLADLGWAETSGLLYGVRKESKVRITTLHKPGGEGQEKIGLFFSRARGEVFLTETNLEQLNRQKKDLAVVVVGRRAGFFVRERDGSIQSVRSHQEFSTSRTPPVASARHTRPLVKRRWLAAGFAALALPLAALTVSPRRDAPKTLEVHDIGGQLRISWSPPQDALLTVQDGAQRISLPVSVEQSTVTYVPRGPEIDLNLLSPGDTATQGLRYVLLSKPER